MKKTEKNIDNYKSIVNDSFDEIYLFDALTYKFIISNLAAQNNLGYTAEELSKLTPLDIKPDYDINSFNKLVKPLKEKKESKIVFYTNHKRKNGSQYHVEVHLQLNIIAQKQYFSAFIIDITKRKLIEETVLNINNRLTNSIAHMPNAYILLDKNLRVEEWNIAAEKIFGFSKQEMLGKNPVNYIVPKKDRAIVNDVLKKLKIGEVASYTAKDNNIRKDGEIISCRWSNLPLADEKGIVFGILILAEDITQSIKTNEHLLKLSAAVKQSANTIVITDTKGNIEFINPKFTKLTGYTSKEVLGKNPRILNSGFHSKEFYINLWKTIMAGKVWRGEFRNKSKSGNLFWEKATITPIKDKTGKIINFLGVKEDITLQKITQQALKDSEEKFRELFEKSNDALLIIKNNIFTNCNIATSRMLGYTSSKQFLNVHPSKLSPKTQPDGKYSFEKAEEMMNLAYKNGSHRFEWIHTKKNGNNFPVEVLLTTIHNEVNNKVIYCVWRDITQRKKIEGEITEKRELLKETGTIASVGGWELITSNNTFVWTDEVFNIHEIPIGQIPSLEEATNYYHPDDRPKMEALVKKALEKGESWDEEFRLTTAKGNLIWTRSICKPFIENGKTIKLIGVIQDITKQKKTDTILLENERRLSSIYNTVGDIIFYLDVISKGVYKFNSVNNSFCNTIGIKKDMVIGKLVNEIIPEPSLSLVLKKYQEAITKKTIVRWEETTNYPKGELTGEVSIAPIFDANGHCTHLVGSVHDITVRKKSELKIKENEEFLNITGEVAKVGGWELDLNTQNVKWSRETKRIHEVNKNFEPKLDTAINFYHIDDREMVSKNVNLAIEKGEPFDFEARIISAKGKKKWVKSQGKTVIKDGKCIRVYGSFQDISEYKKIEKELAKYREQLEVENVFLKEEIALSFNYEDMVYSSTEISEVLTQVEQVSSTDATVLILGETGTGKELIAKAIHNTSDRKNNSLIRVNCAAIPTELIESELFGHIKGSFTGAINNRIGKFELANGGTLFLDEIGEMPLALQPKLLRAIQEGEIEPIGSSKIKKLDVRIIAATNKDLKKEAEEKRFREDLYFRLNVFPITIPALRERTEDIPILIDHFVNKFSRKHRKEIKYISNFALLKMRSYAWPGNVRELENLIERAVIISNKDRLELKEFDKSTHQKTSAIKLSKTTLEDVQRNHILKILNETQWKIDGKTGAAVLLDMKPSTLRDRMKKFGISRVKA